MRLIIIILLIPLNLFAGTYYVATDGDDSTGDGSIGNPWASWAYGIESLSAGDTLYIRGGTYTPVDDGSDNYIDISNLTATKADPTCIFAYPGENPILDGQNRSSNLLGWNTAFNVSSCHHMKLKGLTVRNFYQVDGKALGLSQSQLARGFNFYACTNLHFEDCITHDIGGRGWYSLSGHQQTDSSYWINCDAYDCVDSLSYYIIDGDTTDNSGNGADGMFIQAYRWANDTHYNGYILIDSCRAWNCSDDQINIDGNAFFEVRNTWVFNDENIYSGLAVAEVNGLKLGTYADTVSDTINRKIYKNLIAQSNYGIDFNNALDGYWPRAQIYNNSVYNCADAGIMLFNIFEASKEEYGTPSVDTNLVLKNNISFSDNRRFYNNPRAQSNDSVYLVESNNTWKDTTSTPYGIDNYLYSVTSGDFLSLNIEELKGARQSDGTLPSVNFMKLAPTSDLIDGGIDVGLTYNGTAPDVGAFEYIPSVSPYRYSGKTEDGTVMHNGKVTIIRQ